jgi:hypothetical protein
MKTKLDYTYTHAFTEREYLAIYSGLRTKTRWLRLLVVTAFALACLFSAYTFLLGIMILGLLVVKLFTPKLLKLGMTKQYQDSLFSLGPVTFRITPTILQVRGFNKFRESSNWRNLSHWTERNEWLILTATAMVPICIPIATLKKDGVYDQVLEFARRHAFNYDLDPRPRVPFDPGNLPLILTSPHLSSSLVSSPKAIRELILSLPSKRDDRFASLRCDQLWHMQTAYTSTGFVLMYQEGTVDRHFVSVRDDLNADEVIDAFTKYARSKGRIVPQLEFKRMESRGLWKRGFDAVAFYTKWLFSR